MEDYVIRFAKKEDIPSIMQFIDKYWKSGHILAEDRELFYWQYVNYNKVSFILGCNFDGNILGVLGYIPYDNTDVKNIALALWKANHMNSSFLGIEMLTYLLKEEPHDTAICLGINPDTTAKIYEFYGMTVDQMSQWYRIRKVEKYKIAKIENSIIPIYSKGCKCVLNLYKDFTELEKSFDYEKYEKSGLKPFKSKIYLKKRYFVHPTYDYKVYGVVCEDSGVVAVIVFRIQEYNGARAIRFVDCIGDFNCILFITKEVDRLLDEYDAEYIDMYEVGVPDEIMLKAGWRRVKDSGNIIPNYFSPFQQCNVDINYCSSHKGVVLFKGDGDQDRPN